MRAAVRPIVVYGRRNSANVQKVMWALGELGLAFHRLDVGGSFGYPDDYPHPDRLVPMLADGDVTLSQSNACVRYLSRRYGPGGLWPDDPRSLAAADQWMDWQATTLGPVFLGAFVKLIRQVPSDDERPRIAERVREAGTLWQRLDRHLAGQEFVAGRSLTMGDIPLGAIAYRYFTLPIERPALPNVERWYRAIRARDAYRHHVMIPYGSNPDEWLDRERDNAGIQ